MRSGPPDTASGYTRTVCPSRPAKSPRACEAAACAAAAASRPGSRSAPEAACASTGTASRGVAKPAGAAPRTETFIYRCIRVGEPRADESARGSADYMFLTICSPKPDVDTLVAPSIIRSKS